MLYIIFIVQLFLTCFYQNESVFSCQDVSAQNESDFKILKNFN